MLHLATICATCVGTKLRDKLKEKLPSVHPLKSIDNVFNLAGITDTAVLHGKTELCIYTVPSPWEERLMIITYILYM